MPTSGPKTKIVFFGSGPVAAASLELLLHDFEIEAVITKPRPMHHHGSVPVLALATTERLPVIEASSKRELSEKLQGQRFESEVAVLIDFGIIVTSDIMAIFPKGIINSHFSLLPEWRGADPITFAILSGQSRTGVSLMKLVEAMDEGPILAIGVQELTATMTTPELTDRLIHLSYGLLQRELPHYLAGSPLVDQAALATIITDFPYPYEPSYSRKLTKDDGIIDSTKSAVQLEREIRAFIEWPKSRLTIAGKDVVITAAHVAASNEVVTPSSSALFASGKQLCLNTAEGILVIDRLKPAGKPEMGAAAFLAGYRKAL